MGVKKRGDVSLFEGLVIKQSNYSFSEMAEGIIDEIRASQLTLYAVVNHQADMEALQVPPYPAVTIIFGNPCFGSKLLQALPYVAIDIPLRIAVIEAQSGQGSQIVFRDMDRLFAEYGKVVPMFNELSTELNQILHRLVDQALTNMELRFSNIKEI